MVLEKMFEFIKKNKITAIIVIATLALGGIAIFTALRLYNLRSERVAPNAPESVPAAADPIINNNCDLSFSINLAAGCNDLCVTDADCTEAEHICYDTDGDATLDSCRSSDYPTRSDCMPAQCNESCTVDGDCEDSEHVCADTDNDGIDDTCRLTGFLDEVDCKIPVVGCNESCTVDASCVETGHSCVDTDGDDVIDSCRLTDYPDETDCKVPPTPTDTPSDDTPDDTPTPTPVALPEAGIVTPTIIGIGTATLLFLGAFILAL